MKKKYRIGLKDRNPPEVSEELRRAINECLSESSSTFRLEDFSKHSDIRVDEEDDEDCRRGREAAQQMMSLLEKKDLREIKDSFLPHQGKLWHQWSQKNKELHRPRAYETEMDISKKQTEMKKIREQQHKSDISEFMKFFIKEINTDTGDKMFFIKWLGIILDEYISADLSAIHKNYDEKWSAFVRLKENYDKSEQLKDEQTELERISEDLQAAAFGVEHIMREIGQIYESCSYVKKNKKDLQFDFSSLPSLAAEMMISGFPLELMDGDAAHVPVIWISAVIDELIQKLGDQRVFVLSVLGIQSSGKSTMLNAMFGLQFAVSAGRCTRGAFMQLVKVSDEMKTQMNFDYILVVDTEGLRALELAGRSIQHHDNELATFVVGLANLTLINIFGENPSEMQDILQIVVQAFLRMKKVRLNPRCVFVHQNVSDVTAGEKNMEGRRRLLQTLDKMTKLAAEEEVCDAECFSDVIRFDIQKDVKYFAQLWEGSPPMAPPNPDYCENIQELKETIMSHASKSHGTMLIDLKGRIKDLWEALLKERFVFSFRNSLEISAYRKLETKYSKWSWSLHCAMMEIENKLHNKIENEAIHEVEETDLQKELKKTSEEVEKSMSEFFEKDKDKDILIQWKKSFEIKIKDVQENLVRETKKKLNGILQQRDLKKKIDAKRTHHENTLYEKSKELPLKLKDKANDEETLKKEFELFWEQNVDNIVSDTPSIKYIDIMRDLREILSDVYESAPLDHIKENSEYTKIFTGSSYCEYVIFKKSTKNTLLKAAYRKVKKTFGHSRTREKEAQIKSLITDVAQQTDKMIQSFNISTMGYNISCIKQLTDYIKKRVTEHQEKSENYVFKNEFFIDLVLSICERANKTITDQHRLFKEANDPAIYVEKKREEYYSIFQKQCHEATSAAIFGKIICQKLKEPIEQSVYKKTARDLTYEIMKNCESLKGNRLNIEKHILKTLAEEEDFVKYMDYINYPSQHFKSFIRDEVSRYICDKFSVSVLPKMEKNIKLLQWKIIKAAHKSTEHVQVNRGDVGLWLKSFTQQLSDVLIFSEKDLSGVKHEDVEDFNLLEDVIKKELPDIMSDISKRFNTVTFPSNLDYKIRPDTILIGHFLLDFDMSNMSDFTPTEIQQVFKTYLENPLLSIYNDSDIEKEKQGSTGDATSGGGDGSGGVSASLTPTIWDKTIPYDGETFHLEYMDLDEFLLENGIPVTLEEELSKSLEAERQAKEDDPQITPNTLTNTQIPEEEQDGGDEEEEDSLSVSNDETTTDSRDEPERVTPPPMDPEEIEVNISFQPDPTDLVLSSVPGGELFNPRKHRFSEDELKPQPMIKKAKKVFVAEDAKDDKYWCRRKKNNVAAKRSRDARRLKENQIAVRASFLERENAAMRREVAELRKDCGRCQKIMSLYEAKYGAL
ncbi:interferon-induced very large GTPase 1-like [Pimephales promelas]|nr:interferon-induced very large GTPase 1-like [Pimephales promelas]